MRIIDRYLFLQFFRVFLMTFVCLLSVYVIADFVGNLAELLDYGKQSETFWITIGRYYGARIPWFFEVAGRNIAMLSAVLTIAWLYRDNELTALMAAGVSRWRVAIPLIVACVIVATIGAVNREYGIPPFRTELCRSAQDLARNKPEQLLPRYDGQTNVLVDGKAIIVRESRIEQPKIRLPQAWQSPHQSIGQSFRAENAIHQPATTSLPAGFLLQTVDFDATQFQPFAVGGREVILTPQKYSWLAADQVFLITNLTLEQLRPGRKWTQYSDTRNLVLGMRTGRIDYTPDTRLLLHSRFVQPLLDMTLVFLGLPFAMGEDRRKVMASAMRSLLVMIGFGVVVIVAHGLGMQSVVDPVAAAWIPLLVLVPCAFLISRPLTR